MALPTRALSLFSGAGGLDLGLRRAIPGLRTFCYVEREAYAASVLVARMADSSLDEGPCWDDVSTFDGRRWRGLVDLVHGGFPCQDISNAGSRIGIGGKRSGLWVEFARIIRESEPEWVFIENVSALRSRGLDVVLGDLAALGFDAEWGCVRASDAGAPHKRDRLFVLAHAQSHGRVARGSEPEGPARGLAPTLASAAGELEHALGQRLEGVIGRGPAPGAALGANPLGDWPPGPDDREGWEAVLAARPDLEPAICRMAHGLAHRVDRLRLTGNGVVPHQAALAFSLLYYRFCLESP